uniref:Uncharacterized protein n=1 Tax=Trichuris muris TaxID=70415 RepID=A0A5S6QIZ3_TRIMR
MPQLGVIDFRSDEWIRCPLNFGGGAYLWNSNPKGANPTTAETHRRPREGDKHDGGALSACPSHWSQLKGGLTLVRTYGRVLTLPIASTERTADEGPMFGQLPRVSYISRAMQMEGGNNNWPPPERKAHADAESWVLRMSAPVIQICSKEKVCIAERKAYVQRSPGALAN